VARPRNDGSPSASQRIEAAFFEVLERTPIDKMTVSTLVRTAGVNRNSFYYHYADLDALAESAVANLLIPQVPRLLASGFGLESPQLGEVFAQAGQYTGQLRRMAAVVGPNSSTALRDILKGALLDLWLGTFGLDERDLDRETTMTVHFALGGMLEALSRLTAELGPGLDLEEVLEVARGLPIVRASAQTVVSALAAAAGRD